MIIEIEHHFGFGMFVTVLLVLFNVYVVLGEDTNKRASSPPASGAVSVNFTAYLLAHDTQIGEHYIDIRGVLVAITSNTAEYPLALMVCATLVMFLSIIFELLTHAAHHVRRELDG